MVARTVFTGGGLFLRVLPEDGGGSKGVITPHSQAPLHRHSKWKPQIRSRRLLRGTIHKGHDLRTGAVHIRAKRGIAGAHSHALRHGPRHGVSIIGVRRDVREAAAADRRRTGCAVQEGYGLSTSAGSIRGKGSRAGATGDTLLHGPQNRVIVVHAAVHVGERVRGGHRLRRTGGPPEECHHLRAGAAHVRAEGRGAGALGHAVLHGPQDSIIVVRAGGHVGEHRGLRLGLNLRKGGLDSDLRSGHLKGVLAVALVG